MTRRPWLWQPRAWLLIGLVGLIALAHGLGVADLLSASGLARHRAMLADLVSRHWGAAALLYVAGYVAVVALSIPGAVFLTLAGGFLFGALWGTLLTVAGATAGATLLYLLARAILGEHSLDRLGPGAQALAIALRRNAASYLLALRLAPVFPFFLVNLVAAIVGVRLATYVVTTAVGILPATAVFSLAGAGLEELLAAGEPLDPARLLSPPILAALLGLAALALVAIPLRARLGLRR
ncbi:MAG: VTT domain-containing protein [Rhodovarius sp.]|nr:VTT domain-containing protein [Rhodovarius sp.]